MGYLFVIQESNFLLLSSYVIDKGNNMKQYAIIFFVALIYTASLGQVQPGINSTVPPDFTTMKLQDRYVHLKKSSETFQDYKVIKETILDETWKVVLDSIKKQKADISSAKASIVELEAQVATERNMNKEIRASMEETVYESTHISFLGLNFSKSFFIWFVVLIVLGQLVFIATIIGKLKLMRSTMKEKIEAVGLLSSEYEEYKKRAMEKQVKLSRELQTERNKLRDFLPQGSTKP
jgi:hypothetical protein